MSAPTAARAPRILGAFVIASLFIDMALASVACLAWLAVALHPSEYTSAEQRYPTRITVHQADHRKFVVELAEDPEWLERVIVGSPALVDESTQ